MAISDTTASPSGSVGDTSQRGSGMINKVREKATEQLSSQKERATDGLGSVAQAVRQSTQQLRDQQHETLAGYVESAADQIDRLSQKLRDKDVGELFEDAQRLARRQPAVFIGGAFALGVIGARFLKSSSPRHDDYRRDVYSGGYQGTSTYGQGAYGGTPTSPTSVASGTAIDRMEKP